MTKTIENGARKARLCCVVALGTSLSLMQGCATKPPVTAVAPAPVTTTPVGPVVNEEPRVTSPVVAPVTQPTPPSEAARLDGCAIYTVKQGDSLSRIAAMYGVRVNEIAELNLLKERAILRIGQQLLLPPDALRKPRAVARKTSAKSSGGTTHPAPLPAGGEYTIRSGDSLSAIAAKFKVKVADLKSLNNLTSDRIVVGKKLKIPGAPEPKVEEPVTTPPVEPPVSAVTTSSAALAPVSPDMPAAAAPPAAPAVPATPSAPAAAPTTWQ
jgi:LysM repeat protein